MQRAPLAIGVIKTPKLRGRLRWFQAIGQLVEQSEHIRLAQLNRLLYHLRWQDFVDDLNKYCCAQMIEVHFSDEADTRLIPFPRRSLPIVGPVFEAAIAVLENRR